MSEKAPDADVKWLIEKSGELMRGMRGRTFDSGIRFLQLHHTADPGKRTNEWRAEAFEGLDKPTIKREYDLHFEIFLGQGVYLESFNESAHVTTDAKYNPLLPMIRAWDFGHDPNCVFGQLDPEGYLNIVGQILAPRKMALRDFIPIFLAYEQELTTPSRSDYTEDLDLAYGMVAALARESLSGKVRRTVDVCDPAGAAKGQASAESCVDVLRENGIMAHPGPVAIQKRLDGVVWWLTQAVHGTPRMRINPDTCKHLIQGFCGGYRFPEKALGKIVPVKDEFSHDHDALQYLCWRARRLQGMEQRTSSPVPRTGWRSSLTSVSAPARR